MEPVAALLAALLALMPNLMYRPCVDRRHEQIAKVARLAELDASVRVPAAITLVVGLRESHWGCNPRSGGCWGAPIDMHHRGTAGTPHQAAQALHASYRVCGSWRGAIGRFRSGACRPTDAVRRAYVASVVDLVRRASARAGVPAPDLD